MNIITVAVDGENVSYPTSKGTVGEVVTAEFRTNLNISDRAVVYVNGVQANDSTAVPAGATLSFRVEASSKSA